MKLVGVISDTHGLLRPGVVAALQGMDTIVHAGDIGDPAVLERLRAIAPLVAVRGNVDLGWARTLPDTAEFAVEGRRIYVLHNLDDLAVDPRAAGFEVVVSGHSHRPGVEQKDGVLHVNPGSAGPRRFRLPIALALIEVSRGSIEARILKFEE